jgi:hypothetical protein
LGITPKIGGNQAASPGVDILAYLLQPLFSKRESGSKWFSERRQPQHALNAMNAPL